MRIRPAVPTDREQLSHFFEALWPQSPTEEHGGELALILEGKPPGSLPLAVFVAEGFQGVLGGFIEVGLRSHADGCDPSAPVGFVGGWFVTEGERKKGVGKQLMAAGEEWARSQGCKELASDTWIDNAASQRVHEARNFEVVDRCVHYRKAL